MTTAAEVGLELGKKAATKAVSAGIGKAGEWAGDAAAKAFEGASTFANVSAQAGISFASSYVTSVSSSAINSFYIGEDGLTFDGEGFGKSLYSGSTLGGALGAGITAGLNEYNLGIRYSMEAAGTNSDGTTLAVRTANYTKVQGFNSAQISGKQSLNGLIGGLASNAVGFAIDGETTLNILNTADFGFGNTGLLELNLSKDGVSSKIGMGGTNVSISNINASVQGIKATSKNNKINKYTESNFEGNKTLANALRMQYGFGDSAQLANLEDILSGKTKLELGGTDGKAQTVSDGTNKTIYMNMTEGMDWKEAGLLLGHEAYRDGIKGTEEEQFNETVNAVLGHTTMALRMGNDYLYKKEMAELIAGNKNLSNDIDEFNNLMASGNIQKYAQYIDGNYDFSADYWKVNEKGNLYWDGQFDLVDENGNLLEKANKKSLYASYAQFKGISVEEAKKLFESDELNVSFREGKLLSYNSETGKFDIDRTNDSTFEFETSDKFKASYDFQVNYADKVATKYVNMQSAFEGYQNDMLLGNNITGNLGEYLKSEDYLGQLIGFYNYSIEYDNYIQTYYSTEKNTLYNSKEATGYLDSIKKDVAAQNVTNNSKGYDGFGANGVLNPVGNENTAISTRAIYNDGKSHLFGDYGNKGFSVDIARSEEYRLLGNSIEGSSIYTNTNSWLYGDSVFDNPTGTSYGSEVRLYGNDSTYIYGHMQENSIARTALKNLAKITTKNFLWRSYMPAGVQIGNLGSTGNSTGPHLHWEYRKGYQR